MATLDVSSNNQVTVSVPHLGKQASLMIIIYYAMDNVQHNEHCNFRIIYFSIQKELRLLFLKIENKIFRQSFCT